MYEVEVKVRASHAPVRDRLTDLDAEPLGTVEQVDTYYDAPHRDFAATDEALRLRAETDERGTETRITYKGPLVDAQSKTRREAETTVGDRAEMEAVLDGLGFAPAATVEKERERFALDGYTVTLDSVAGLGAFVEVEREVHGGAGGPDADSGGLGIGGDDVETAREGVFDVLRRLGLDPGDQIRTSYLGLLLE